MLERDERGYPNTPATASSSIAQSPAYIGGMLEMANARLYPFWGSLTEGLRTGEPQNEAKGGGGLLRRALRRPGAARAVPRAMTGISTGAALAIAAKFPWDDTRPSSTSAAPRADCRCRSRWPTRTSPAAASTCRRSRPIFEELRRRARARRPAALPARRLLRRPAAEGRRARHGPHPPRLGSRRRSRCCCGKAYDALPDGGALIVYEAIIDDDRRTNAFGLLMSLNMLIETPGGFDYTGADCQRLDGAKPASARPASSTSPAPTRWSSASNRQSRRSHRYGHNH